MRRASNPRPILPADWTEVLERVQQTLEEADAAATRRAEALNVNTESSGSLCPRLAGELDQMRERLDKLSSYVDRATGTVSDADVALGAGEEALRTWLQASETGRRRLADWVGRA
jgi:hypothetical protein